MSIEDFSTESIDRHLNFDKMILSIDTAEHNFDLVSILKKFEERETTRTGSIIIHRGKVKSPGKKIADLSHIMLEKKLAGSIHEELSEIGRRAGRNYKVNQVYINHRLGRAQPGEDILLVIVSAPDRGNAFAATQWIVDEIKKEKIITLTEIKGKVSL
ncbi:MAG: molybdenum cofactor biosynthesis protein MoaE [bacterium]